jgi:hypothetical protein
MKFFWSIRFPDTFWSFKHALQFIRKRASLPPLGLLTVAAMLPSAWEKRLVDMNVRKLTEADLEWAEIAFVSAMAVQRESARAVIARCKDAVWRRWRRTSLHRRARTVREGRHLYSTKPS